MNYNSIITLSQIPLFRPLPFRFLSKAPPLSLFPSNPSLLARLISLSSSHLHLLSSDSWPHSDSCPSNPGIRLPASDSRPQTPDIRLLSSTLLHRPACHAFWFEVSSWLQIDWQSCIQIAQTRGINLSCKLKRNALTTPRPQYSRSIAVCIDITSK